MIKKLPKEFLDVISTNNDLSTYLSNLNKDVPTTRRSWLYEHVEPDTVLDNWLSKLESLRHGDAFEQRVFQFDTSQLKKWGPQGGHPPMSEVLSSVVEPTFARASSPWPEGFKDENWKRSVEGAIEVFFCAKIRGLRPASYNSVVGDMRARDTLESNSGWPNFSRRNNPNVLRAAMDAAKDGEFIEYPAIALFRYYNLKLRLVWMFPEATNIVEGSFTQPCQSAIVKRRLEFFTPWVGFDAVRKQITQAYAEGRSLAASDFSATDEHFTVPATIQVYEVLKHLFQKEFSGELKASLLHMHSIPLIISRDEMLTGKHGVASGSNWTNFVESVFDLIFSEYVSRQGLERGIRVHGVSAIGDDMCWETYPGDFNEDLPHLLEECGHKVGQDLNAEKVTNDRDSVKYLQRLFQRGYKRSDGQLRAVYSTVRALKSSVYPERMHNPRLWSSDMFCARQYMILENCVDHPLFEEFVKFIVHGQRDLIPFASKSAAELDAITRKSRLIPGLNPTYNQEKRDTSLANFESVRLVREMLG